MNNDNLVAAGLILLLALAVILLSALWPPSDAPIGRDVAPLVTSEDAGCTAPGAHCPAPHQ